MIDLFIFPVEKGGLLERTVLPLTQADSPSPNASDTGNHFLIAVGGVTSGKSGKGAFHTMDMHLGKSLTQGAEPREPRKMKENIDSQC